MSRLVVCSDVHGFYDELMDTLNEVEFDKEKDLFISCGDNLDRGPKPQEVIDFMLSLPNAVFIKGNHESLFQELCDRAYPQSHDRHNGTAQTILDLAPDSQEWPGACIVAEAKYKPLLDKMVDYYETANYIFVHSWIPRTKNPRDWRNARASEWERARWENPFDLAACGKNITGKTIVHGHWNNSYWWSRQGIGSEWGHDANSDVCEHNGCIGLDGCVALTHNVNVLVIENEDLLEDTTLDDDHTTCGLTTED